MSKFTECPADVAPGDIVRCMSLAGLKPDGPLKLRHVYTVRGNEGFDGVEPAQRSHVPVIHLEGIPGVYGTFRFELVARRAEAEADLPSAVAARMAEVMRRREAETGACTFDDLARAGFTMAQIVEFKDEARGLAGAPSELAAA